MKTTTRTILTAVAAGAATTAIAVSSAPAAFALPTSAPLGTVERLTDGGGTVVQDVTVSGLQPSSDTLPNVPLAGKLWEATATINDVHGTVTPSIPFFNARTADGQNYRVLFQALSPTGLSSAPLNPGGKSTGKVYFDVTGPTPTSVVYNDAVQDRAIWAV
jgi:hypothetical protein